MPNYATRVQSTKRCPFSKIFSYFLIVLFNRLVPFGSGAPGAALVEMLLTHFLFVSKPGVFNETEPSVSANVNLT